MAKIDAIPVAAVEGCVTSADGRHALLRLSSSDKGAFTLALPFDKVQHVLQLLSGAAAAMTREQLRDPNAKFVAPVERWEVGSTGERLIFAFHLPGGAEQAFQVSMDQAPQIVEAIVAKARRN